MRVKDLKGFLAGAPEEATVEFTDHEERKSYSWSAPSAVRVTLNLEYPPVKQDANETVAS